MGTSANYRLAQIIENVQLIEGVYKMVVKGSFLGKPGQFYMLRAWDTEPLLSRPISICDRDEESISFLYLVVGKGTRRFSSLEPGDSISLMGPVGNGFPIEENKKAAIIMGGIGIAPMLYLAKHLQDVDIYAGFRDKSYFMDAFAPYAKNIHIASESGAEGTKGNVLHIFKDKGYDVVYACGPTRMLQALKENIDNEKLYLSLEAHMACGIGACLGCTVECVDGMKRVCHEGPVFSAKELLHA